MIYVTNMSDEPQPQLFHVSILHADGTFGVESFMTVDEAAARLRELINKDVSVAFFKGVRLNVYKPPKRY